APAAASVASVRQNGNLRQRAQTIDTKATEALVTRAALGRCIQLATLPPDRRPAHVDGSWVSPSRPRQSSGSLSNPPWYTLHAFNRTAADQFLGEVWVNERG